MSFFKNLKEDFSKAVNELLPDDNFREKQDKEYQALDETENVKSLADNVKEERLLNDNNDDEAEEEAMAKFKNRA